MYDAGHLSLDSLGDEENAEMDLIFSELSLMPRGNFLVQDKCLKRRIATHLLNVCDQNPDHPGDIQSIAYHITGFFQFTFNDQLDEITAIASELELPPRHLSEDPVELFNKIKRLLASYLNS